MVHGAQQSEGLSQGPLAQQVKCVENALSMCVHGRQLGSFLLSPGDGCVNIPSQFPSLATGSFGLRAVDKQIVEKLQVLPLPKRTESVTGDNETPQHRADSGNLHKPPNQPFCPSTASDWHFPNLFVTAMDAETGLLSCCWSYSFPLGVFHVMRCVC